jgi:putative transposase
VKDTWIRAHHDVFPVAIPCSTLQVSSSGYDAWRDRPPSPRAERTARIEQAVQQIHAESHGLYGSVKVARVSNEQDDRERACRNTVAQAMRKLGLNSRIRRRFTPTTTRVDPTQQPAPNTLDQDFTADAPNRKWVTDITYLATSTGWVYLAVVLDLFSRKVVGWAMHHSLETELVSTALRRAIEARRPEGRTLLHHSDRGCQYTGTAYQQTLKALGIECSMSRTGCCCDNAVLERFFWSLKHEWTNHGQFATLEDARLSVCRYIETFYNSQRRHQTLGDQSPNTCEANFPADHAPAAAA